MTVSAGIIAYNSEHTIERCIHSVLSQSRRVDEILIYLDGCTDNTEKVVNRYSSENVQVFTGDTNRGIPFARNFLLRHTNTDIIVFFDSDDYSCPSRVEGQVELLESVGRKSVLCYSKRMVIQRNKRFFIDGMRSQEDIKGLRLARVLLGIEGSKHSLGSTATCTLAGYVDWLKNLKGFDETFLRSEDTDIAIQNAFCEGSFICTDDVEVYQYLQAKNYSVRPLEMKYQLLLVDKWCEIIGTKREGDFAAVWIDLKYNFYTKNILKMIKQLFTLLYLNPRLTLNRFYWVIKSGLNGFRILS